MRALSAHADRPFTMRDIAEETGVGEKTVRTVLGREQLTLEAGVEPTGRRGAQRKLLELKPDALESIQQRLAVIDAAALGTTAPQAAPPSALLAAEEALLALDGHDAGLLEEESKLAWLGIDAGTRAKDSAGAGDRELDRHLAVVTALLGLAELELATLEGTPSAQQVERACELLAKARAVEPAPELQAALTGRVARSPVRQQVEPTVVDLVGAGASPEALVEVLSLLRGHAVVVHVEDAPGEVVAQFDDLVITGGSFSRRPAQHGDFRVLVLGDVSGDEDVQVAELDDEPLIVFDAYGSRPELEHQPESESPLLYLRELPQLGNAMSFALDLSDRARSLGSAWFTHRAFDLPQD